MSNTSQRNHQRPSLLLLGSQMETGGAQQNLLSQALWFHQHEYAVTAAFLYDKEGLFSQWQQQYPFPLINLKAKRWGASKLYNAWLFICGLLRLFRLMHKEKFDSIETFTHHANLAGIPLAWLSGIPNRIANHRGRFKDFPVWQEKFHAYMINSKMTTQLVANSRHIFDLAVEEGIKPEKITIIHNGVDLPYIDDNDLHQMVCRELSIDENSILVLSVGRLRYEKGHTFLLQAIPAVLQIFPDTVFLLAGDGTLRSELEHEAQCLAIRHAVHFLGNRKDAVRLMAAADIFVLPSRSEGMPNALLEAMGMGTAAISTRVGGAEEIIQHEVNGLLVDREDPQALAKAILFLLKNESFRRKIADAGKKCVLSSYTRESMCQKFCSLLDVNNHRNYDAL